MQYIPPPHVTQNWRQTKPAASGRRGIVVSQSNDAAYAGLAVLEAGGNAIDAAVATALALPAVEPWNSGLGGIGFAVVHRAGQPRAEVVDFGPVAPRALTPDRFRLTGRMKQELFAWPEVEHDANIHGPLSFAIPSAVAGYAKLHELWGSLPLADVIAPAVALAERGLANDWYTIVKLANAADTLALYEETARIYLPGGRPRPGAEFGNPTFFRLGHLAHTLARLRDRGLRDFYEGETAAALLRDIGAIGGVISADDLAGCEARVLPATQVEWRGGRTMQLATGLTAAPTLAGVLADMRVAPYGAAPDPAWFATLAASLRAAYAERLSGLGEPVKEAAESCTTHLTVCDAAGTMVAVTTTLLSTMGSRVVLPETGVLMNNGVMWFDPRPGQPNSLAPGKRPLTNMCPTIIREGDRPVLAAGASGGRRIMAAVFQLATFVADFGMTPEAAARHPRIDVSGPEGVTADERLGETVIAALERDAPVERVTHRTFPGNFANPNLIVQGADGNRTGVSDAMSPWSMGVAQG